MSILDGVALPYKADESPGAPSPSSDWRGNPRRLPRQAAVFLRT